MSGEVSPERISSLVTAALDPDAGDERVGAQKDLADLLMDAPGAATFQATLTTILGDAYMAGWRDGVAGTKREVAS